MNLTKPLAAVGLAAIITVPFLAQAENPGTLDTGFNPVLAPSYMNGVFATRIQSDGKILIGGDFTSVNGQAARGLARLNSAGALDSTFTASPGADGTVWSILETPDNKILVGGAFNAVNGANWRGLARLTSSGSPDPAFGLFSGLNSSGIIYALALQPDGKILIGGSFTTVNGAARSYMARLNTNGTMDVTFTPLFDGMISAIVARPNGRILVGGSFANVNNAARAYLVQLNPDGTTDANFNSTVDWSVNCLALQGNGQAILGGWFGYVGGAAHNYLARVNSDGSVDNTFTASASGVVYSLALQPNGKIVVGGQFSSMNGTSKPKLAVLNSNGLLDSTFNTGVGPNSTVRAIALQADGKIVIGGEFTTVSMAPRTFVARVWGDPPPPVTPADDVRIWTAVEIGWNSKTNTTYQIQWSPEASPSTWQNLGAPITGTGDFMSVFDSTRASSKRFYRVIKTE